MRDPLKRERELDCQSDSPRVGQGGVGNRREGAPSDRCGNFLVVLMRGRQVGLILIGPLAQDRRAPPRRLLHRAGECKNGVESCAPRPIPWCQTIGTNLGPLSFVWSRNVSHEGPPNPIPASNEGLIFESTVQTAIIYHAFPSYLQDAGRVRVPPAPSGIVFGNCDFESSNRGRLRSTWAEVRSSTAAPRTGF